MNRINRVSSYLVISLSALLVLIPVASFPLWFFVDTDWMPNVLKQSLQLSPILIPEGVISLSTVSWTPVTKALALLSVLLERLPLLFRIAVLRTIFKNYEVENIFSAKNARLFRKLGLLFFVDAFLTRPISDCIMTIAATLSNGPGHRYVTFGFGTPNFESLFCGIMLLVVSWVMLEASTLHEEQKLTI